MDIKEFVSESLKQIVDGVVDFEKHSQQKRACNLDHQHRNQKVTFDIAVTVVEGKEAEGKAGISVWSIGAGVTGRTESSSSIVNRIKSDIPIEYQTW
jgi:hypothetical protein